jgi:subtilase family serine protease
MLSLTPVPDLVVSALSTTTGPLAPGAAFSISSTVANQGSVSAGTSLVGFVLSRDAVYGGTDDILMATGQAVPLLAAGATITGSKTLTVPSTTPLGNYYVCAVADKNTVVAESKETNNSRCTTNTIQVAPADLVMTAVSGPLSTSLGTVITIANTVKNQGAGATGAFYVGLYLSTDATITTADTFLARRSISGLAIGGTNAGVLNIMVPATLAPGTYYVGAIADYDNRVISESNEANNSLRGTTIILTRDPDLDVRAVYSSVTTIVRGGVIGVTVNIGNQGLAAASTSFNVGIYLSKDRIITTADTRIGVRSIAGLAAGTWVSTSNIVSIPLFLAPGTYYIGAIVDYPNTVKESNETNNTSAGSTIVVW